MAFNRTSPWRLVSIAGLLALSALGCQRTVKAYPDELAGVGVVLQTSSSGHKIANVVTGGPAASAGLEVGDHILTVNGESMEGRSLASVVDALRGRDGSSVVVRVQSTKGSDVTVTLKRQHLARSGAGYHVK